MASLPLLQTVSRLQFRSSFESILRRKLLDPIHKKVRSIFSFVESVPEWPVIKAGARIIAPLIRAYLANKRIVTSLALIMFVAMPIFGETFSVDVKIFCPANLIIGDVADPTFGELANGASQPTYVPCAGIRVVALDADYGPDEFCGVGYTDSTGRAAFPAQCSDNLPGGGKPNVYLRIEGRSFYGFSVGTHSYGLFDALRAFLTVTVVPSGAAIPKEVFDYFRSHETYVWELPGEREAADGEVLKYSNVCVGDRFPFGDKSACGFRNNLDQDPSTMTVSEMAAREFWAAQYSMARLHSGAPQHPPMDFNINLDEPFGIGTPTTLWDTIAITGDRLTGKEGARSLAATPHEIGHVLYNSYHSGMDHWFYVDGTGYMQSHQRCENGKTLSFAWYEGFANFARDYVFQSYDWPMNSWRQLGDHAFSNSMKAPFAGCGSSMVDMHHEGNVQALLNNIFFGPVSDAQLNAIAGLAPAVSFTCPAGFTLVNMPDRSILCEHHYQPNCPPAEHLSVDGRGTTDVCRDATSSNLSDATFSKLLHSDACESRGQCPESVELMCPSGDLIVRRPHRDECIHKQRPTSPIGGIAPVPRPDGSRDLALGIDSTGNNVWFGLPALDDVIEWVRQAGTNAHHPGEFWDGYIRPWCLSTPSSDNFHNYYCNPVKSPNFSSELQQLDPALH